MQCVSRYGGIGLYTLVRVLDNTVLTSVHVCADKWTVIHHDVIKNYDARIVVAVSDSKGSCRPHFIDPVPEARHFYPKEAVTKTGPRERVTAILIDNDNNTYYRHATYPPEKQGLRAALVFNLNYDGLTKQTGQTYFEEAIKNVEKRVAKHHPD